MAGHGARRFRQGAGLDAQPARFGGGGQCGRIGGDPIQARARPLLCPESRNE